MRDPNRATEDAARRPEIPANGMGGQKVELARTWDGIQRLHGQRATKANEAPGHLPRRCPPLTSAAAFKAKGLRLLGDQGVDGGPRQGRSSDPASRIRAELSRPIRFRLTGRLTTLPVVDRRRLLYHLDNRARLRARRSSTPNQDGRAIQNQDHQQHGRCADECASLLPLALISSLYEFVRRRDGSSLFPLALGCRARLAVPLDFRRVAPAADGRNYRNGNQHDQQTPNNDCNSFLAHNTFRLPPRPRAPLPARQVQSLAAPSTTRKNLAGYRSTQSYGGWHSRRRTCTWCSYSASAATRFGR